MAQPKPKAQHKKPTQPGPQGPPPAGPAPQTSRVNADSPYTIPAPGTTQKLIKQYKNQLKAQGYRGEQLTQAVNAYRRQTNYAQRQQLASQIPEEMRPYVKNPKAFMQNLLRGKGPAWGKLALLQQAGKSLGYGKEQEKLSAHYDEELGKDPSEMLRYDESQRPIYGAYQQWLEGQFAPGQDHGLTPEERAQMRASQSSSIAGSADQQYRDEAARMAQAGIDPRSGLANARYEGIAERKAQALQGMEADIAGKNLARKGEIEGQAAGFAGAEEAGRRFDVGTTLNRLGQIESGQQSLAGLGERQREYDVDYTESQRQAAMARKDTKEAADKLRPTSFEKASAALGGLVGGLTGKGGGAA